MGKTPNGWTERKEGSYKKGGKGQGNMFSLE